MNGLVKLLLIVLIAAMVVVFVWSLQKAPTASAAVEEPDCPWPHRLFKVFVANVSQCKGVNCFYGSWDNPVEPGR
jgi:hypothetical protein